jgi:hypothetical protein
MRQQIRHHLVNSSSFLDSVCAETLLDLEDLPNLCDDDSDNEDISPIQHVKKTQINTSCSCGEPVPDQKSPDDRSV